MSLTLEMLTKAADLVETQEEEKRLLESPSPSSDNRKPLKESKPLNSDVNGNGEHRVNGTGELRRDEHTLRNGGRLHDSTMLPMSSDAPKSVNNHHRRPSEDEIKNRLENSLQHRVVNERTTADSTNLLDYHQYQKKAIERVNGTGLHRPDEKRTPEHSPEHLPERYWQTVDHRQTSPAADRGGDTHPSTKPMVLLQHPTATTFSSVGSAQPHPNPALHATATMHHPYLYSMMYPTGAPMDSALNALNRVPGSALKDGEGLTVSPNGSPNGHLTAAAAAGMHFPAAGLMYPFANQAMLMGARAPGGIADISPMLLAQSSAAAAAAAAGYPGATGIAPNPLIDQYKRFIEGMQQFPTAYPVNSFYEHYVKSLIAQGMDAKDAMALGMVGRMPQGIPLAALQAQSGAAEMWMRYPEQLNAAMGVIRPPAGASPRSASPYTNKRHSDSPVIANSGKIGTSSYPYHTSLGQPSLNSLNATRTHVRSPASLFSQGHRSRSPHTEVRKSEAEATSYRSHSRDLDRDVKPTVKELASTSVPANHGRNNNEHLVAHPYSVTDETGRKIPLPSFYPGAPVHMPHGYPLGMSAHHAGQERSPSPLSRGSEDRSSYHRQSRDRSPGADLHPNKRRSLDNQYRQSPVLNDRHNSRPTSPATNGHNIPTVRHQLPLVNGGAETLAEFAKTNPHLLQVMTHARSPNTAVFSDGREQRNCSPATNPYVPSFFAPHLLGGTAGSQLMLPQYAQALAATAKNPELAALYKVGENGAEYQRLAAGLPFSVALPILPQQQQHLFTTGGRSPHVLSQEYALKTHSYLAAQANAKENEKCSPANGREKHPGMSQHHGLVIQQPPQALSPGKSNMKHSPTSQFAKPTGHHVHRTNSQSPLSGMSSSAMSPAEGRRYLSPQSDRSTREGSPKPSSKPYRPNPMLRQHAEDLERSRKRKLMEEEIAMGEEASNFHHGKQHLQQRQEQLAKDSKKEPKRRKQLVTENDHNVEEHFRRSLGSDYKETSNKVSITGSVDDHFEKALGIDYRLLLQSSAATPPKSEPRDVAGPHTTRTLPSYSVALASGSTQAYPTYADGNDPLTRLYDPSYLSRERYQIQSMAPSPQHRKTEKSPPRGPGSTVLYSTNPPVAPAKQRVKAKAVFPENPSTMGADVINRSSSSRASLGSKGSSRSVSGSSAESLPVTLSKSPPVTSQTTNVVPEGASRASVLPPSTIPYTYPHSHVHGVPATAHHAFSRAQPPVISPNSSSQNHRPSSPASPRPVPEEKSRSPPVQKIVTSGTTTKETKDRQSKESRKSST